MLGHADRQVLSRSRLNLAIQMGSAMFFHLELAKSIGLGRVPCRSGFEITAKQWFLSSPRAIRHTKLIDIGF